MFNREKAKKLIEKALNLAFKEMEEKDISFAFHIEKDEFKSYSIDWKYDDTHVKHIDIYLFESILKEEIEEIIERVVINVYSSNKEVLIFDDCDMEEFMRTVHEIITKVKKEIFK